MSFRFLENLKGMDRIYTPEQANRMLGQVREIVIRIVELKKEIDSLKGSKRNEYISELGMHISKLEDKGIELKDVDTGLIDFPATRFGDSVYLCWKLGEPEVMYWHDLHGGFKGRRLLKPEAIHAI